jgi:hypothetical protein
MAATPSDLRSKLPQTYVRYPITASPQPLPAVLFLLSGEGAEQNVERDISKDTQI